MITSSPPFFVPMNVGHAVVTGGSIEIVGRLAGQWFLRANFTSQLARDAATSLDVIYVPRRQANLELSYEWAPGSAMTGIVTYVGDRFADAANTSLVPGYLLVGLNATWALGEGYSFQAGINNVFDVTYQESLGFPEPGRTVFMAVTKTF
ncbi:MAG: TonB-dependent receptor [Bacillati bacterium ANGP1]|uniref:TonB-dependent receptor n=1 Tax=Candidatus Segetimicrobium genomatis TaxID=2569760 RepID=A0A537JMZ2_9BACT|nr:MAG: TonB-dependent receptor [Terrabacteria group bacterium ANGP1]